ncbi:hypothetical protein C8R45DRAFT_1224178 [Mycena sanguinolenta]|nr:hypothetical protein C8R45DRAFT_1224178 [Mycena sanguinolenta]
MEKLLIYRKTCLWLLAVYLPTLIVPWVLICVLDVRPLNAPSYNDQSGSIPPSGLLTIYFVVGLIRVLNSISGVLVVPVVGTIIAQAAVVFSQRRGPKQNLNLIQLFALADRGWGSIPTLWSARSTGASSSFLWVAALMTMISSVQQPIQSALVSFEIITVMSCLDVPVGGPCSPEFPVLVAYDAEPGAISLVSHNLVVTEVANSIVAMSDLEQQPNLWVDNPYANVDRDIDAFVNLPNRGMFFWYSPDNRPNETYFVSALQNGTMTGVLRQHAIRMNSSTSCESIPRASFPTTCGGARPVQAAFSNEFIEMRVCAPGEVGTTPWTLSRNRQDISEELYIDIGISSQEDELFMRNFTTKCTANSTRGYFELGNYFNGFAYGPLIEEWPAPDVLKRDFNDYLTTLDGTQPSVEDPPSSSYEIQLESVVDPFGTEHFNVSGPLITAASVLFGNNSFLNIADPRNNFTAAQILNQMCQHGSIPFALPLAIAWSPDFGGYCFGSDIKFETQTTEDADSALAAMIGLWFFSRFNATENAEYVLDMSMFFANRAVLNKAVLLAQPSFNERPIYTSPGIPLIKPTKTLAGTIIVSVFIAMQLVGLGLLVSYIYSVPTWTTSLDALAVAQIARGVSEGEIPPLGPASGDDRRRMRDVDALIGVKDGARASISTGRLEELGHTRSGSGTDVALMMDKEAAASSIELTIGGPGFIRRGLM